MKIKYRKGYKYQLAEDVSLSTSVVGKRVETQFFCLEDTGRLTIRSGYAWDGASGPTWDTDSSMSGSLVHDVFCQMMRAKQIDYLYWHKTVNELFKEICMEDGMWEIRASVWYAAVEFADAGDPAQGPDYPVYTAP